MLRGNIDKQNVAQVCLLVTHDEIHLLRSKRQRRRAVIRGAMMATGVSTTTTNRDGTTGMSAAVRMWQGPVLGMDGEEKIVGGLNRVVGGNVITTRDVKLTGILGMGQGERRENREVGRG